MLQEPLVAEEMFAHNQRLRYALRALLQSFMAAVMIVLRYGNAKKLFAATVFARQERQMSVLLAIIQSRLAWLLAQQEPALRIVRNKNALQKANPWELLFLATQMYAAQA